MADKLSVTISLEGGKEIQQELAGIGKAGQKAFDDISKAAEKAGGFEKLKPDEITAKLKTMGIVGEDAINKINRALASAVRTEQLVNGIKNIENGLAAVGQQVAKLATLGGTLGGIAAAFGPVGLAIGAVVVAVTALVHAGLAAAENIGKIEAAASRAGISIEKFNTMQEALTKTGVSANGAATAIQKIADAIESAKLDQVTKATSKLEATSDFKTFQEDQAKAADAGGRAIPQFGVEAAKQYKVIQEAAMGSGEEGKAARAELEKMGQPIPEGAKKSVEELAAEMTNLAKQMGAGSNTAAIAKATMETFIGQLEEIKDPAERNAVAMQQMGDAGLEIARGLNTGAISSKQFADAVATDANTVTQAWANTAASVEQSLNKMQKAYEDAAMTMAAGLPTPAGGKTYETGAAPGFASGGVVGGRGTGTSDSNLALVSRGEHIMPAAAVRQPGVLSMLETLRASGGSLRGIGRFALGGPVMMPAFAAGGHVGGGMAHLGTVDLRTDHGSVTVMANSSAVEQLGRLAVTKRMTSTGRKPGFVG